MKIGKMYKKSLRDLLKGPMALCDKKDITRYRNLEKMGLVKGVGLRCVSITKAGLLVLKTGEISDPSTIPPIPLNASIVWSTPVSVYADDFMRRFITDEDQNVPF